MLFCWVVLLSPFFFPSPYPLLINRFLANVPISYPLKTQENQRLEPKVFLYFQGVWNINIDQKWVKLLNVVLLHKGSSWKNVCNIYCTIFSQSWKIYLFVSRNDFQFYITLRDSFINGVLEILHLQHCKLPFKSDSKKIMQIVIVVATYQVSDHI